MNCAEIETRLRAYLDSELPADEEPGVRAHLEACTPCRSLYDRLAAVAALLHEIPLEEPPAHFTTNLQLRLAHLRAQRRAEADEREAAIGPDAGQYICGVGTDPMLAAVVAGTSGDGRGVTPPHHLTAPQPHPLTRRRWPLRRAVGFALAGVSLAASMLILLGLGQPRISAAELVGKVQESWARLRNYQCTFVSEGVVRGIPRRFEQRQWFRKPNLFRVETREHYLKVTYLEPDRVTVFMPGSDWQGRPVAIVRARKEREPGLPFPFGSDWPETEDITIDALVRQLKVRQGAEVLGTETVLGKACFVLKFHTRPVPARRTVYYLMWIDQDSFLPLKVKRHEDMNNHLVTEAVDLKTNTVFPSDTFRFQVPQDAFVARGDVESHVFALRPVRTPEFDRWPVRTARHEIAGRQRRVRFRPLAPGYMPPEFRLLRVRSSLEPWLDAYWVDNDTGRIVKLVERPAGADEPEETRDGGPVTIPTADEPRTGRMTVSQVPYLHHYVSWKQEGITALLATSELTRDETLRIAGSMEPVPVEPEPAPAVAASAAE